MGAAVTPEQGADLARIAAFNALAAIDALVGLDVVTRVVKVVGFVASASGFTGQPAVVNGASNFLGEVFGDAGAHARSAVGVYRLPLNFAWCPRAARRGFRISPSRNWRRAMPNEPRVVGDPNTTRQSLADCHPPKNGAGR